MVGGFCEDGAEHDIVDPDNRELYDPSVLARYDATAGPRPNVLWSYCAKCSRAFRWSVSDQQWRPWPGGLSLLPHLSDEELDELHVAVVRRTQELGGVIAVASNPATRAEINYKLGILHSLDTAVQEARYGLFPPEGPYEPRLWGEAWKTLEDWVQVQIDGIDRSSQNDMSFAAAAAFAAIQSKIADMRRSNSGGLPARRSAEIDLSRPQPGSAEPS